MAEQHDVPMVGSGIDGILSLSYIVRCVVDPHDIVRVHAVTFEVDAS
jgi:hypothetical protein